VRKSRRVDRYAVFHFFSCVFLIRKIPGCFHRAVCYPSFSNFEFLFAATADSLATQFCCQRMPPRTVQRCIGETVYGKKDSVARTKQSVAFKNIVCYVLSMK